MFCALVLLVCLWLTSITQAVIVTGQEEWGINLDSDESLTAIAHFVWGSVEFTAVPEQTDTYTGGGIWGDIGWQAVLLDADRMIVDTGGVIACIYGPTITGGPAPELFSYNLFFQWDDEVADSAYPVYIDTAIFDGPYGSEPFAVWGWRGIPGDPGSWEFRVEPYYKDEPGYEEGFYNNPIPEPATLSLLALGSLALLRKRKP
jgi:hypothetical protein